VLAPDAGAFVPGVPQPAHDVDELVGDFVAFVVLKMPLHAIVARASVGTARHHVPGDASLAQVLQGLKRARNRKGRTEARRYRGPEANVTRGDAQGGHGRGRLEARLKRWVVVEGAGETVGNEEQIELAALGDARAGLQHGPAAAVVPGALHAPTRRVIAGAEPEHGQMHLATLRCHTTISQNDLPERSPRARRAQSSLQNSGSLAEDVVGRPEAGGRTGASSAHKL